MRKHACSLLLSAAVLVTACNKQDAPTSTDSPLQQAIAKVNTWLDDQRTTGNEDKNLRIQQIKDKLDYTYLRFEELRDGEKFIIVPLKQGFQSRNNTTKNPLSALLLIENKSGGIRMGNIAQYISLTPQAAAVIPVNSFFNIFNAESPGVDAQFSFLTLSDRLVYQVTYKDGIIQSSGTPQPGLTTAVNSPPQAPISPEPICTDWYLLTTYYYADGHTEQTQEYLYTTCEPNGGGGGESGNEVEYELAVGRTVDWTVAPNPENGIGEIKSIERLKGKKVPSEPQGGHFIGISHYWSQCNFCSSNNPYDVWTEQENQISATGQQASSYVAGRLNYNGTVSYPHNTKNWRFDEINW